MNESISAMLERFQHHHHMSSASCCFSSFVSSFFFSLSLSLTHTHTHTYTGPRYCYFFLEEVLALPLVVLVSVAYALLCTLKPNIFGTYVEVGGDGRR